jgi:hypothetical protein
MAIFPVLETEDVIQIGDKIRLNGTKSFVSKDNVAVTLVEIEPEAGNGYITVTGTSYKDWYLDWSYSGATRTVVVSLRITAGTTTTVTQSVSVVTAADDYLFSNDYDIKALEPDILKYVPEGRKSYLNVHREAQKKIIDTLDEAGYTDTEGLKLTKAAVVDISEVRAWSKYLALSFIFRGIYNAVDDVFAEKARHYESMASKAFDRAKIRLDLDGDGEIAVGEAVEVVSRDLVRE